MLNQVILLLVDRTWPYLAGVTDLLVALGADRSFPPTAAPSAIATALALGGMPRRPFGFGMAALLVAFSRVFLGIHYAGDALGGVLTRVWPGARVLLFHGPGHSGRSLRYEHPLIRLLE